VKLLLDENLPHRLRSLIVGHDVFTVTFMRWNGIDNGKLLAMAAANGFDAVITQDSGISHQQNLATIPCSLIVLEAPSNALDDLAPLVPELLRKLDLLPKCAVTRIR
jgi:predicted nuclease of predicted toxin-antitoxin system